MRGVLEAYRYSSDEAFLHAARRAADGMLPCIESDGRLPAHLDGQWRAAASHVCLTGSVQNAHNLFILYEETGQEAYLDAGRRLTGYVRRTIRTDGPEETRGGVKGSFPVDGAYGTWEYLNWAAKFAIDANVVEKRLG